MVCGSHTYTLKSVTSRGRWAYVRKMPPKARSLPAAAQSKRPSADSTTPRHTVPHHIADPLPSSAIHVPDASPTPQPKRKRTRSSRYAFLETLDADDAPTTAPAAARAAASTAAIDALAVTAPATSLPVSEEVAEISVCILRVFCVFVRLR